MKKLYSLEGKWPNLSFYSFSKNSQKTFLILLLMFSVGFASAQSFVVNGLKYTVTTALEVSVNKDGTTCPTGALTIPSLVTDPNSSIEYSVRTIEANAFAVCTELTSVTIGDSLTTIGNNAFRACSSLTSATLPNSLTNIGSGTFENCSALTSVTLPNSLTTIGSGAFTSCSALTSITLPNSVTTIESETFENCSTLTSIDLPDSLTNIGSNAFRSCTGLTSVDLPESLTTIGNNAFRDCSILEEVNVAWQTPITITSLAFSGLTLSDITLKVPSSTIYLYEAAAVWTNFNPISAVHNVIDTVCGSYNLGDSTYTVSGMYTDTITTTENNDSIMSLALTILEASVTNLVDFSCTNYVFGGDTLWASGTYSDTLTAANTCDSIVNLVLTIVDVSILDSLTLTINGATISTLDSNVLSYQWIDCSDSTIVAGQDSSSFSPTQSGTYKAVLSVGSCSDTTDCVVFTSTSIVSNALSQVVLYPNPTRSDITIVLEQGQAFNMIMTNVLGEIVLNQELVNIETTLQTSGLNKGIYFVNLYNDKGNQTLRFVKH